MGPQLRDNLLTSVAIPSSDRFLPARSVWERYGVTSMTIWRWVHDEELKFPAPVYMGRFRYWRLSELLAWEADRPKVGARFGAEAA